MDFKDYYATLGVTKTSTDKEIKQAFRRLARKHHPDVNPGDKAAEARFKEINEAYEVLGDPDKRRKYDELGANWRQYEEAARSGAGPVPGGGWQGGFGAGGGGFRTMSEEEMRDLFGEADPFSDFFHVFFGGAGQQGDGGRRARAGRGRGRPAGRDVEQEIELSLTDALHGTTRRLAIKHDGHARTVDVRIPAGVNDGSRVRVPGEGEQLGGGAKPGDLYLRIRLAPDPRFERKGADLYTRVSLPLTTAVLGGETDVTTLSGKTLRLKVPAGTQQAQVFRFKGHGMPLVNTPGQTGDLYATVDVQLPRTVTPEQRTLFEELRKLEHRSRS
jgi:DnaJ-class molecular chaperone